MWRLGAGLVVGLIVGGLAVAVAQQQPAVTWSRSMADCVLTFVNNAHTDTAANLVVVGCRALNP